MDATVLDGAVVARLLKPRGKRTFGDYAQPVFLPSVEFQLESAVERLDVVWDRYFPDSLKDTARQKISRQPTQRQRVDSSRVQMNKELRS